MCGLPLRRSDFRLNWTETRLLHVGRHQELLGELSSALQRHPLDERIAGQLMLAQYRSGRQAQALETYRQMRERLVEELGVDPSPILRDAHQQILDGDRGSTAVPPRPDRPCWFFFPRRPTSFIGRELELARVAAALHEGPLLTLTGVGGVGKTGSRSRSRRGEGALPRRRLAVRARAARGRCSSGPCGCRRLAPAGRQGLDIEATVIEYLGTRELLLIMDNCEHLVDAAAAAPSTRSSRGAHG